MKKILVVGLVVAAAVRASAAEQRSFDVLESGIRAFCATNSFGFTNLANHPTWTTNLAGTQWTNSAGTRVVAAGGTVQIFRDIPLDPQVIGPVYLPIDESAAG